jgi:hypothetical protein
MSGSLSAGSWCFGFRENEECVSCHKIGQSVIRLLGERLAGEKVWHPVIGALCNECDEKMASVQYLSP